MTTEEARNMAGAYYTRIGDGHRNAVRRPDIKCTDMDRVDRSLRRMINHANKNGDFIIPGTGGYYRPVTGDPVDELEYKEYRKMEEHRVHDIIIKNHMMDMAFENRRREAGYAARIRDKRETDGAKRVPEGRAAYPAGVHLRQ